MSETTSNGRRGLTRRDLFRFGAGSAAGVALAGGLPRAVLAADGEQGGARSFVARVTDARVFDLSPVWNEDSPVAGVNPGYDLTRFVSHEETRGQFDPHGHLSFTAVTMEFSGQHGAPSIDALGHIGKDGTFHDGTAVEGSTSEDRGLLVHDMTTFDPSLLVNRGVLLDVARHVNGDDSPLAADQAVTGELLEATATAQDTRLLPGDTVLIRTGWGRFFGGTDAEKALYQDGDGDGNSAGVDVSGARFLADHGARVVGNDTIVFEVRPPVFAPTGDPSEDIEIFPVHMLLIAREAIHIVENFWLEELAAAGVHEFVAVLPPLKIEGAAGSPLRALAIAASEDDD